MTVCTETPCAHCGLPVPEGLISPLDADHFCCVGCRTAFGILQASGLDAYYRFSERREQPVQSTGRRFDEFDHPAFHALYVRTTREGFARTELYLEGVHCASCVWLVERVPLLADGVIRTELDVRRALAVVEWQPAIVPLSVIARTLDALGYRPHPFGGVAQAELRRTEDRAMLVRLGVAGAIAINMMLAALALYAGAVHGMEPPLLHFFRWISLGLTVPALIWPGRVFFTGAAASIRTRSLHMDVPIAMALAAGFIRGTINTVTGTGPIYFDGLALLIFALLVGRFLQQRGQRLAADAAELLHALAPTSARLVEGEGVREVPAEALLPGMIMEVRAGDLFAADGLVVRGQSRVNAALLTGESGPVKVALGSPVFGGTMNIESPLRVEVTQAGEARRIAKLLRQMEESARRRAPIVQVANRMAGVFTACVLLAAAITFGVKVWLNQPQALDDAIALLIVTCPCALALATPLVMSVAISRAAGRGMLIKGGDTIELLSRPGLLVLDKTGTLTEGQTTLAYWHGPDWVKPLLLALEGGSSHPIAEGLRRAWRDTHASDARRLEGTIDAVTHQAGHGITGVIDGRRVRLGSERFVGALQPVVDPLLAKAVAAMPSTLTPVHVMVDGVLVAVAGLGDQIRPDAREALDQLRARGWRTIMLSGDNRSVVEAVRTTLGFQANEAFAAATPEQKLAVVLERKAQQCVVMVGDGVNDAAAIAAANVGIGVHGGAEACLASADVYLTDAGLSRLVELTDGARRTMQVIRRNMAYAIGYNCIGATLAVTGVISPLIAAILMPVSSVTVVLGSWFSRSFERPPVTHSFNTFLR